MELSKIMHEDIAMESLLFTKKMQKEFGTEERFKEYKKAFHEIQNAVKDQVRELNKEIGIDIYTEEFSNFYNNKHSEAVLFDVAIVSEFTDPKMDKEKMNEINKKNKNAINKLVPHIKKAISDLGYANKFAVKIVIIHTIYLME